NGGSIGSENARVGSYRSGGVRNARSCATTGPGCNELSHIERAETGGEIEARSGAETVGAGGAVGRTDLAGDDRVAVDDVVKGRRSRLSELVELRVDVAQARPALQAAVHDALIE